MRGVRISRDDGRFQAFSLARLDSAFAPSKGEVVHLFADQFTDLSAELARSAITRRRPRCRMATATNFTQQSDAPDPRGSPKGPRPRDIYM